GSSGWGAHRIGQMNGRMTRNAGKSKKYAHGRTFIVETSLIAPVAQLKHTLIKKEELQTTFLLFYLSP
ncbi:MAG: hypothetical protein KC423_03650, partial [Anaerolineales bacterium]|nr:hypothetical protein [Anaerolineales bacterium]